MAHVSLSVVGREALLSSLHYVYLRSELYYDNRLDNSHPLPHYIPCLSPQSKPGDEDDEPVSNELPEDMAKEEDIDRRRMVDQHRRRRGKQRDRLVQERIISVSNAPPLQLNVRAAVAPFPKLLSKLFLFAGR